MFVTRVLPFAAVLGTVTCTSADILRLDPSPRPQTNPDSIQLLGQEPTRPYKVIAIVSAQGSMGWPGVDSFEKTRSRLIKEAARLGGDAVLFDVSSVTRGGGDESAYQQLTGKVIVFTPARADSSRTN